MQGVLAPTQPLAPRDLRPNRTARPRHATHEPVVRADAAILSLATGFDLPAEHSQLPESLLPVLLVVPRRTRDELQHVAPDGPPVGGLQELAYPLVHALVSRRNLDLIGELAVAR